MTSFWGCRVRVTAVAASLAALLVSATPLAAQDISINLGNLGRHDLALEVVANDIERADILRAATGYALGEDMLGLGRLHEKYTAKMAETPDARAFEIVHGPD